MSVKPKPASPATKAHNEAIRQEMALLGQEDFANAARGFIAPLNNNGIVIGKEGNTVWDVARYDFLEGPAPDTVNPSLWRQSQLAQKGGLFKVAERIYQVRNQDSANITFIEGDSGLIVVDTLTAVETAQAALALYYKHRPQVPVLAVLISHTHPDHTGGIRAFVSPEDFASGKVALIAPKGLLTEIVNETLLAGSSMFCRAVAMFGMGLPASPQEHVGIGLGMSNARGTQTLLTPSRFIERTGESLHIDGLDFEFLMAPDTESPAEMHWYIPQLKALTVSENAIHTMHNTYTLRGAHIRDPLKWSQSLQDTLERWGDQAEVLYAGHFWPVWGQTEIVRHLSMARDGYRLINDETLRLANKGLSPEEIAETIKFPPDLQGYWGMRGHYGTLYHNAKATYFHYLGWFDGDPTTLHPLNKKETARKTLEYMGGADAIIKKAQDDFDKGEYRWVAQVLRNVVLAAPENQKARALLADALEQLGYQAEAAPWRNFYLTGARELRLGPPLRAIPGLGQDVLAVLDLDQIANYMSMRLDALKAGDRRMSLGVSLTDTGEKLTLVLSNGAISHTVGSLPVAPDVSLSCPRGVFTDLAFGRISLELAGQEPGVFLKGDSIMFSDLQRMMDDLSANIPLITAGALDKDS